MGKLELAKCAENTAVLCAENRTFPKDTSKRPGTETAPWIKHARDIGRESGLCLTPGSLFTGLINLFSPHGGRNYARAVIQEHKAKCSLFTHNLFFLPLPLTLFLPRRRDVRPLVSLAALAHIATRNETLPGNITDRGSSAWAECASHGELWNFYERPASKFLTPRKIRYFFLEWDR